MAETLKKIQDLINQNRILEKRNEELKKIIDINLSTPLNRPTLEPTEILGKSEIESIVFKFYSTYKIPASLCNLKSEVLFTIGWKKLFNSINGLNKNGSCIADILNHLKILKSDIKYSVYKCEHGFNAIVFPIEINHETAAVLIFNQFLYKEEKLSYESIKKLAEKFDTDEKSILDLLSEIPVFNKKEIKDIVKQGILLAEMISFVGTKNLDYLRKFKQQSETASLLNALKLKITEQDDIIKSLINNITEHLKDINDNTVRKSTLKKETKKLLGKLDHTEAILNSVLISSPLGICFVKEHFITFSNDQMHQLIGYTARELLGQPIEYIISNANNYFETMQSFDTLSANKVSIPVSLRCKNGTIADTIGFLTPINQGNINDGITLSFLNLKQLNLLFKNPKLKSKILNDLQDDSRSLPDWSKLKILIAEDEEYNYQYLKKILQPSQIQVHWVQNGKDAVEFVRTNPNINLVLMDIKMPVMNGIDATRLIKTLKPQLPVIAQTAFVQDNTKEAIFEAGCDEFLSKPIDIEYLTTLLKKHLNKALD